MFKNKGFPRLSFLAISWQNISHLDPQIQALLPRMTTIVELLTARKGAVPAPQSTLCLTASCVMSPVGGLQQVSLRDTITPHRRQIVGSLGTRWHTVHKFVVKLKNGVVIFGKS